MSAVLAAVERIATRAPERRALVGDEIELSYGELKRELERLSARFAAYSPRAIGLLLDNSPAWAVIDLAAQRAGIAVVPLPAFFSAAQLLHALRDGGVDLVLTDAPLTVQRVLEQADMGLGACGEEPIAGKRVSVLSLAQHRPSRLPAGIAKVTYTSGTTGAPKGVCLRQSAVDAVAGALAARAQATSADRHLSVLPLAVLLENVGGLYAPLMAGATCCLPSLHSLGTYGAARADIARLHAAFLHWRTSTAILVPQLLQALIELLEHGAATPVRLRFVAVGGAPVSRRLLLRAQACRLPVYEGYGLSECASVVAVNGPGERRLGSVGRPLPHVRLQLAVDGEILVSGARFGGYLDGSEPTVESGYRTGDVGHLDADGFLYVTGRKKHMFVTSYGRNVAPEWVERELTLRADIAQAALFGEGRPWNVAVIVPRALPGRSPAAVDRAVNETNATLPDYARVGKWILADAPFSPENGELTATGRVRRDVVWAHYRPRIAELYRHSGEKIA